MEPVLPEEPERFRSAAYRAVLSDLPPAGRLRLPRAAAAQMQKAAEEAWPAEACGLLIGRIDGDVWHVAEARAAANLNTERAEDRFELDPDAWRTTERELRGSGLEIIGVWHSHPDCPAKPSPTDLAHAWEGLAYPILSVHQGRMSGLRAWQLDAGRFREMQLEEGA